MALPRQRPDVERVVLEASGVVQRHRKGRDHILSINVRSLDEIDGWIEGMRHYWAGRLDAMERLLDELNTDHSSGTKDHAAFVRLDAGLAGRRL